MRGFLWCSRSIMCCVDVLGGEGGEVGCVFGCECDY